MTEPMAASRMTHDKLDGAVYVQACQYWLGLQEQFPRRMWKDGKGDYRDEHGTVYGQRLISPQGEVRFGGHVWQSDLLLPLARCMVGVKRMNRACTGLEVYWPSYPSGTLMMRLLRPKQESSDD